MKTRSSTSCSNPAERHEGLREGVSGVTPGVQAGIGIDIALGGLDFEEEAVARAVRKEYTPEISLRVCTAEGLIVMKAFADRDRDWLDLRTVLVRRGVDNLDWPYIDRHLTTLSNLKEEPEIMDRLLALREEVEATER